MRTNEERLSALETQVRTYRRLSLTLILLLSVGLTGALIQDKKKSVLEATYENHIEIMELKASKQLDSLLRLEAEQRLYLDLIVITAASKILGGRFRKKMDSIDEPIAMQWKSMIDTSKTNPKMAEYARSIANIHIEMLTKGTQDPKLTKRWKGRLDAIADHAKVLKGDREAWFKKYAR